METTTIAPPITLESLREKLKMATSSQEERELFDCSEIVVLRIAESVLVKRNVAIRIYNDELDEIGDGEFGVKFHFKRKGVVALLTVHPSKRVSFEVRHLVGDKYITTQKLPTKFMMCTDLTAATVVAILKGVYD